MHVSLRQNGWGGPWGSSWWSGDWPSSTPEAAAPSTVTVAAATTPASTTTISEPHTSPSPITSATISLSINTVYASPSISSVVSITTSGAVSSTAFNMVSSTISTLISPTTFSLVSIRTTSLVPSSTNSLVSTTETPSNMDGSNAPSTSINHGLMAGAVVGTIIAICAIILIIFFIIRQRRQNRALSTRTRGDKSSIDKAQLHDSCLPQRIPFELVGWEFSPPGELPAREDVAVELGEDVAVEMGDLSWEEKHRNRNHCIDISSEDVD